MDESVKIVDMNTPSDQGFTSNQIPQHVYELIPTGGVFGADCECGDHLNEGNGAVVGGRAKVLAAIARYEHG
jgi:hypothetical protein